MFAAVPGPIFDVPIWQTYIANVAGAIISASIFYGAAELVMNWDFQKRIKKYNEAIARGESPVHKKRFTRTNKFLIRLKKRVGWYGVSMLAPLLLSIPLGSIVTAKFYGRKKGTIILMYLGLLLSGCLTTGIPYLLK